METSGEVEIEPDRTLHVTFDRRCHNPILREAALDKDKTRNPLARRIPNTVPVFVRKLPMPSSDRRRSNCSSAVSTSVGAEKKSPPAERRDNSRSCNGE